MKTKTKVKPKVKRTRASSIDRAPRSSYAQSKNGKELHQFSTINDLRFAKKAEKVRYISSAKFLALAKTGLPVKDRRNTEVQVKRTGTPVVVERGGNDLIQRITTAVALALGATAAMDGNLPIIRVPRGRGAQAVAPH